VIVRTAAAVASSVVGGAALPWLATRHPVREHVSRRVAGRGRPDHVALTFDDGPDPRSTPAVMRVLDGLAVRATFFLLGEAVDEHPSLAADLVAAGHEVAVHGYAHRSHLVRTPADVIEDAARAYDAVVLASGTTPLWYRPPYGSVAWGSWAAARRVGLRLVLWTAWGRDWRPDASPEAVTATVVRGLDGGGTVVLHDTDRTSAPECWRATVEALPQIVEACRERGWAVGTVADHGLPPDRWPRW
jgi:peptidoglycan/xylan/chitin deacetylase (PgdA/CDA1 family)